MGPKTKATPASLKNTFLERIKAFSCWPEIDAWISEYEGEDAVKSSSPTRTSKKGEDQHQAHFDPVWGDSMRFTWLHFLVENRNQDDDKCEEALQRLKIIIGPKGVEKVAAVRDVNGQNPIFYAAKAGRLRTLKTLITEYGMDPVVRDHLANQTALFYAAADGRLETVMWLVACVERTGVERYWDQQDALGETPLYYAIRESKMDVVKFLLAVGASTELRTDRDQSIWEVAKSIKPMQARNAMLSVLETDVNDGSLEKEFANDEMQLKAMRERRERKPHNLLCVDGDGCRRSPESKQARVLGDALRIDPELLLPGLKEVELAESKFQLESFSAGRVYFLDDFRAEWVPIYMDLLERGGEILVMEREKSQRIVTELKGRLKGLNYRTPQNLLKDFNHSVSKVLPRAVRKEAIDSFYAFLCADGNTDDGTKRVPSKGVLILMKDMFHQKAVHGRVIRPIHLLVKNTIKELTD